MIRRTSLQAAFREMNWSMIAGVMPVQGRCGGRFIARWRNTARVRSRTGMGGRGFGVMDGGFSSIFSWLSRKKWSF
jgi:hypothetical protein